MTTSSTLSRRERQIMDIIYQQERATAADVLAALPDPPSYSSVRALLGVLETKGHLRHVKDGAQFGKEHGVIGTLLPTVAPLPTGDERLYAGRRFYLRGCVVPHG